MTRSVPAVLAFVAVLGAVSLLALVSRRRHDPGALPSLEGWGLADRRMGTGMTWCLVGGAIYTAYTFVAVPGLVYGIGALGFFAVPYTIVFYSVAFLVLPRLWAIAARNGYVTTADVVRGRFGSPALALCVALTGLLATMPYVALQLLGLRALLTALGLPGEGVAGDIILTAVFATLAVATYRSGLRAPALISVAKAVLVFAVTVGLAAVVSARLGGTRRIFADAEPAIAARSGGDGSLALAPELTSAYTTLALGSAFALLVYPHVTTAVLAARDAVTVRRNAFLLPAWTAVLAILALLGVAAAARGIATPPGRAELALPLLVRDVLPAWGAGVVLGVLGIGALVPVAVMSVAAANLFTRNVYVEFLNPTATPKLQVRVARTVSVLVKVGALAFVLALRTEDAINLQLLGGVWILQTAPAVIVALWTGWPHRYAVLAGWAVGMVSGTTLLATNGFVSVVPVSVGAVSVQVYAALLALVANLAVVGGLTPLLDRLHVPRGLDTTGTDGLASGRLPRREWLATRSAS